MSGRRWPAVLSGLDSRGFGARIGLGAFVVLGAVLNFSNLQGLLAFMPYAMVGSLLVIRRPGNLIGSLLLLMAAGFSVVGRGIEVTAALIDTGWAPWLPLLAWLGTMAAVGLFAGMALLSAVFPTGALPGGGIGRMTRAAFALIAGVGLLQALDPVFLVPLPDGTIVVLHNSIGIAPDWAGWSLLDGPAYMVVLGGLAVCMVGLLVRFRRAGGAERQQHKWLLASLAIVVAAVTFGFVAGALFDPEAAWIWFPAVFAFPLPPIAIGVAILRYRLYAIDRIISRTLAYGLVTAVLVAVFGALNIALQGALNAATGGEPLVVAVSTLVVAALFNPLRIRVQAVVDRRFNRARYDAERTVERFSGRLRDELDLATLAGELQRTSVAAVEPATSSVWLRAGGAR